MSIFLGKTKARSWRLLTLAYIRFLKNKTETILQLCKTITKRNLYEFRLSLDKNKIPFQNNFKPRYKSNIIYFI